MTEDGNEQVVHNRLQHTAMLEAEMIHRDKYGAIRELAESGVSKGDVVDLLTNYSLRRALGDGSRIS